MKPRRVPIAFTVKNGLPASRFLFYFGTVSGFTAWVTGILSGFSDLHRGSIKLSALMEFLNYPEPFRFEDGEALKVTPGMPCKIELDDVSFRYDGAAKDTTGHINLTVEPREKIAIVGLNGAGKTTLVKLISGLLDPIAEAEIYSKFDTIAGDKTAVYISHRLSSCKFCDEIAVFDHGAVVQMGTHEALLGDPCGKYNELWHAQAQYYTEQAPG